MPGHSGETLGLLLHDHVVVSHGGHRTFKEVGLLLGDANDDGQVSGGDLIVVQQYFGKMLAPISSGVPEPLTLTWLAMGAIPMLLCRPVFPSVRS